MGPIGVKSPFHWYPKLRTSTSRWQGGWVDEKQKTTIRTKFENGCDDAGNELDGNAAT